MNELEQLECDGYAVFRDFLDRKTTARIRRHMDSLLAKVAPMNENAPRVHELRHPIAGAIMAEILANPRLLELARETLFSDDLRLLEQVLIRSDGQNGERGASVSDRASGWHIDMAFLPQHYDARPRQTYFHMVHALSTVQSGGGAFTIVPGSHHRTYAASAKIREEDLPQLKANPIEVAGVDLDEAIEVLPADGDLLVFNPMCLHSASRNATSQSRYVYFASFYDPSAAYLRDFLGAANYHKSFPNSLRDNLPRDLQILLER